MNEIDKIKVKKLIHSIGLKYNLSDEKIKQIVESQFEFAKLKMKELDLGSIVSEEEFNKLKTNFMFRSFFKLISNYKTTERINFHKKRTKLLTQKKNGRTE